MSIRPIPAGQDGSFTWGPLGKRRKYINAAFKEVPNLSTEEKRQQLINKMKPYNSEDYLGKEIYVVGGGGVYDTTPTPTPTQSGPPPTSTPTPTQTPTQTQTQTPTQTQTQTSTPTPTPTPTGTQTIVSELQYVSYGESASNTAIYTFSNISYSGAGLIIVGVHAIDDGDNDSLSSVTISGLTMNEVVRASSTSATPDKSISAIYSLRLTGGTSADVVVSFNSSMSRCAVSVWRLTNNISDTAYSTDTYSNASNTTTADIDLNLNTGRNHTVSILTARSTGAASWTNSTEQYDFQIASENGRASGAASLNTGSGTVNISSTFSSGITCLVGAVWN